MTKIDPKTLVGAVVEEVKSEGECIECIKLRLSDGRSVDVNASTSNCIYDPWMEVM